MSRHQPGASGLVEAARGRPGQEGQGLGHALGRALQALALRLLAQGQEQVVDGVGGPLLRVGPVDGG